MHLGVDLFVEPGAVVRAPLAGVVHVLANNAAPQDYGPLVVLRHETDDGTPFFTLYGHLSEDALPALAVGQRVEAGQVVGRVGAAPTNGDWPPHLHFQLILDLLARDADFPGVALPSQRAIWTSLSPDPNVLLRIPAERFPPEELSPSEALPKAEGHVREQIDTDPGLGARDSRITPSRHQDLVGNPVDDRDGIARLEVGPV